MAKLQALQAIEALNPDRLAEALTNNGYPQCRQLIIEKGINGAAFLNLTEVRLEQYQMYLKPSDIPRIWSLILRMKEHPQDFVLINTNTRPIRSEPPPKLVRPQNSRNLITQALRYRIAHQVVCVQESSDEDKTDILESEWSDEEAPESPNINDEMKEKEEEVQQFKVNSKDRKSFNVNRERIRKLFEARGEIEGESEQTKRPTPPVPSRTKEPIYINIQAMMEEAEKNMLSTPSKLDVLPKPPRPYKPDQKPPITDVTPRKIEGITLQLNIIPPKQDRRPSKPEIMPRKHSMPDFMLVKPIPPKPSMMQSKPDNFLSKPNELSPEQNKIPSKREKLPPKPIRALNALSKVSQENNKKNGTLPIPPGLNKFLLAASQTINNNTAELPRPEAAGFRLPTLPRQDETSALQLPVPFPPPIPPTPRRSLWKVDHVELRFADSIRLNGNAPPLPRRPLNVRDDNDDEDEEGYLINSDFMSSLDSLNSNQARPLPPVPPEEGAPAAAAVSPLKQNMYYRDVDRNTASNLLALQPAGSFLLRSSDKYFATLVIKQRIRNVPIVHDGSHYYLSSKLDKVLMFSSLDDLISHYTKHKVPFKDNCLCLRRNNNPPR